MTQQSPPPFLRITLPASLSKTTSVGPLRCEAGFIVAVCGTDHELSPLIMSYRSDRILTSRRCQGIDLSPQVMR